MGGDDPGRACDVLVTAAQLAGSEAARDRDRDRCRDRVGGGRLSAGPALGDVEVVSVAVTGSKAVARVRVRGSRERIPLRRVDGRWRIVAPA